MMKGNEKKVWKKLVLRGRRKSCHFIDFDYSFFWLPLNISLVFILFKFSISFYAPWYLILS